jgi:hypothetical protein
VTRPGRGKLGRLTPFNAMPAPEQSSTLVLSANAIIGGVFFPAGDPLPFTSEADLPESLKPFVATAEAPPPEPPVRNIYDLPLSTRRQVRRLEMHAAHQEFAEQVASEPLPPETESFGLSPATGRSR